MIATDGKRTIANRPSGRLFPGEGSRIAFKPLKAIPNHMGKFAIDIDSILYDFSKAAREAFLKLAEKTGDESYERGAYSSWVEWRSPADVCGLKTWLDVVEMCHQPEVILAQTPFAGAVATLAALVNEGHELMYISHRTDEAQDATRQWLMINGFPAADVVCTDEEKQVHIGECQYIIDDRPKTLLEFVYDPTWERGHRKGLSIMYEYNRALTDAPNIFLAPTWSGLNYWMVRNGLLSVPAHEALAAA